jgi:hypothetical protein
VHPSCQTLGATSASLSGLGHVHLASRAQVPIAYLVSRNFQVLLALAAFRSTPPFGEQSSLKSRFNKRSFALHRKSRKLSARNSRAARPLCSRNQPPSAAPGKGLKIKNSWLQFSPWSPVLRAHSGRSNPLPAEPVLLMSVLVPLQMSRSHTVAPNPSIEGMPKRLRLLCTPHVKR